MHIARFTYIVLFVCLISNIDVAPTNAQAFCSDSLKVANQHYAYGNHNDVIDVLRPCLKRFVDPEEDKLAFRLTALSWFAKDRQDSSIHYIKILVRDIDSKYEVSDEDPIFFREQIRRWKPRPWYKKCWITCTGAAALAAGGYAIFRPKPENPLKNPPDAFLPPPPP